ncbi:LacI family DNA-binding transcriptional regulator [uncultured Enterococcus sp.]|uniref:LacI family DNA-binding transcriptional regulator n=1 Tax=uncultured Enterococcus sp. TaxID=167972 RepID=UPI002AA70ADF|nr:LacI family DNA-binding transcriptional regulator [uncultured Enterococcus sp.]
MATIQEVAKAAQVSVGSVSRYLNGHTLRPENMERIRIAIEKLNYTENLWAKGLKSNQSYSIGLLMNNMQSQFSSSVVATIEDVFEQEGYGTLLSGYRDDAEQIERKLDFLLSRGVDGLVVFGAEQSWPGIEKIERLDIPVISAITPLEYPNVDSILLNNRQSTAELVRRILAQGHQKIGFIAAPQIDYVAKERLRGIYDAFSQTNVVLDERYIVYGDYSRKSGYMCMEELLQLEEITAVFVCNYNMSLGALEAIYQHEMKVGTDISFASYDYFEASDIFYPKLTVIKQPVAEFGTLVAQRILQRVKDRTTAAGQQFIIENDILWRDSISKR